MIKTLRYYYWLIIEFFKKKFRLIIGTFFISLIFFLTLRTIYPYFESLIFFRKKIIGLVDNQYSFKNLPLEITSNLSNGLVSINQNGKIIPVIAQKWEILDNGKKFIFKLKPNLVWNNGKKVSAKEIQYYFKDVKILAPDDLTLIFELKSPLPIFINYLSQPIIKYPLIGIGGSYYLGKIIRKNDRFKEINLLPVKKNLLPLCYRFYRSDEEMIIAYKKGEIHQFSTLKTALIEPLKNWKNTEIIKSVNYEKLYLLFFNFNKPFLKERDNRIALRNALDPKKISDFGQIALTSIPPISWVYYPELKVWTYEQELAKNIFLKKKETIELKLYSYYENIELVKFIIDYFEKVGVKINVKYISTSVPGDDFDLFLVMINIPSDPDQYYFWHSSQTQTNISHYVNLKIDKLLEDGRQEISLVKRKLIYQNFQKTLYEDPPAIFLFYPYQYEVRRR